MSIYINFDYKHEEFKTLTEAYISLLRALVVSKREGDIQKIELDIQTPTYEFTEFFSTTESWKVLIEKVEKMPFFAKIIEASLRAASVYSQCFSSSGIYKYMCPCIDKAVINRVLNPMAAELTRKYINLLLSNEAEKEGIYFEVGHYVIEGKTYSPEMLSLSLIKGFEGDSAEAECRLWWEDQMVRLSKRDFIGRLPELRYLENRI